MVRSLFGEQAPKLVVDLVLAFASSAPAWANLASLAYARRAQGRPKIAFLQPLLIAMCVTIAALALVPRSATGLLVFFLLYSTSRLLWAGVETVRAVLWSVNYPSHMRARITGRITINTSVVLAIVSLGIGWLLGRDGPWWRVAILAGAACGIAGAVAFRRFRVRGEERLLEDERVRVEQGASFGLAGIRHLLARDPAFRDYQVAMSMFGAGMLSMTPLLVVCQNDVLHLPTFWQVLVTTAIPVLVVPFAIRPWAAYLDSHRVLAFRSVHGRYTIVASALLIAAVFLERAGTAGPGRHAARRVECRGQPRLDARPQRFRSARRGDALHGAARHHDGHPRPGDPAHRHRPLLRPRGGARGRRASGAAAAVLAHLVRRPAVSPHASRPAGRGEYVT